MKIFRYVLKPLSEIISSFKFTTKTNAFDVVN